MVFWFVNEGRTRVGPYYRKREATSGDGYVVTPLLRAASRESLRHAWMDRRIVSDDDSVDPSKRRGDMQTFQSPPAAATCFPHV